MKLLVIYNPQAGNGRARALLPAIRRGLAEAGLGAEILLTEAPGDAITLARSAELEGYDAVIASGGDGTLFEVLNGLMHNPSPARPPLGLIPNGTGNAFMKELGLRKLDWRRAIDIIAANRPRRIDVGRVEWEGGARHFLNIVGMGFVADIAQAAVPLKRLGSAAYTLATLLKLPSLRAQAITLELDGRTIEREGVFVEVANSTYTGTSFLIAPKARLDDGLLDVVLLKAISRFELLRLFRTVYDGSHLRHPQVEYLQARRITVTESRPGRLIPDGEILGSSPARFECLPGAIAFLWPEPERLPTLRGPTAMDAMAFRLVWSGFRHDDPLADLLRQFPREDTALARAVLERAGRLYDAVNFHPFHRDPTMPSIERAIDYLRASVPGMSDAAYSTAADKVCYLYCK
jgi:diacylglycerol kinase (ATP)